ncbi:MAG: quinone oxidoreductase [Anaerolineae bacterium]|nr:quinone oxidoreductase [Anaerolineae bacterium]
MRAIRVHQHGEPEVMQLEDLTMPTPGPGQVRVRVEASGVNFIDIYQCSGQYKMNLPFTPGQEAAGVVDALGDGVSSFSVGDRVASAFTLGMYASHALIAAEKLVPIPAGVDSQTAAAAMLQGMTAHYLTIDTFPLREGHTALIHAAAGGTGLLLVQMAKLRGARVIATASSQQKLSLAREMGADETVFYDDFPAQVKALTGGRGVDVVYDSVGKDTFERSLECLRPRGYLVLFGQSSGPVAPLDPQVLNAKGSLFLTRPSLGHHLQTREELLLRAGDVFGWIAAGALKVRIDRVYPLAQAADAHRALASRETSGKVLLLP